MNTDKKKLSKNDLIRIKASYDKKLEEFNKMSFEELSTLDKTNMSSSHKKALRTAALTRKIEEWKERRINEEGEFKQLKTTNND